MKSNECSIPEGGNMHDERERLQREIEEILRGADRRELRMVLQFISKTTGAARRAANCDDGQSG